MRSVRESPRYQEQCAALGFDVRRLDEALEGVVWAACKAAEQYPLIDGTDLRQITTAAIADLPELRIMFRLPEGEPGFIDFVWIERVSEDPDDPVDQAAF